MPTVIHLPALSPGMTEGKLVRWLKQAGDWVDRGEAIAEIETDKSVLDLEATEVGRLARIFVAASEDTIPIDTPLALLAKADEDPISLGISGTIPSPATPSSVATPAQPTAPDPKAHSEPHLSAPRPERIAASPLAKRMAADSGIDLEAITGSGPGGRIIKRDVELARDAGHTASYTTITNSSARRITARRLTQAASSIPHFYLTIDCQVDELLALREKLNGGVAATDKLSINDFVIRACALALKKVPRVNSSWDEEAIRLHRDVDIAVAVAAPDSLMTPIIRKADTKSLAAIAAEMRQLATRARTRKLRPEEFQGGGFSISNLGMHGVRQFTSIINPPQVAILAVGAAEARPVVDRGKLAIATVMTCTLSCDHRVLDGSVGAEFLNCFRALLARPDQLT